MLTDLGCGLPPEYCEYGGKSNDLNECKKWLEENHPDMYAQIYPDAGDEEEKENENADGKQK